MQTSQGFDRAMNLERVRQSRLDCNEVFGHDVWRKAIPSQVIHSQLGSGVAESRHDTKILVFESEALFGIVQRDRPERPIVTQAVGANPFDSGQEEMSAILAAATALAVLKFQDKILNRNPVMKSQSIQSGENLAAVPEKDWEDLVLRQDGSSTVASQAEIVDRCVIHERNDRSCEEML